MDLFENLSWRISDPSIIDIGNEFIKEESISSSYVFLNNLTPGKSNEEKTITKQKSKSKNSNHKSCLNSVQHQICLQALQLLQSGRSSFSPNEQQTINFYNDLKFVINQENSEFLKYIEGKWDQHIKKCKNNILKFASRHRAKKFEDVLKYPKYYSDSKIIPLSNNLHPVEVTHKACLLELGIVQKVRLPDIERNRLLNFYIPENELNLEDYMKSTKQPVSEDCHAEFLAKQTSCNIVISSSSLKTIMNNFGPEFNTAWDIPITVKAYEAYGRKMNIVYIDKTLPQRNVSYNDMYLYAKKELVKYRMQYETARRFVPPQFILHNLNVQKQINTKSDNLNNSKKNLKSPVKTNADNNIESSSPKRQKLNPPDIQTIETVITNELVTPKKQKNHSSAILSPKSGSSSTRLTRSARKKMLESSTSDLSENDSKSHLPDEENCEEGEIDGEETEKLSVKKRQVTRSAKKKLLESSTSDLSENDLKSHLPDEENYEEGEIDGEETQKLSVKKKQVTRSAKKKLLESSTSDLNENDSKTHLPDEENCEEGEIDGEETQKLSKKKKQVTRNRAKKKRENNHNVNYRLWTLELKEDENVLLKNFAGKKQVNFLVRSKIDGFEVAENGEISPTNIVAKLESQVLYGAEISTKSDLLKQWTTLYFRPFSNLVRVRINSKNDTYVKIEKVNLNKVTHECLKHHNFLPKNNLGILYNVFSNLTDLDPGNYILHHTQKLGSFATLLKSVPENSKYDFDLHDFYKDASSYFVKTAKWIPIDTTCILSNHIKNNIMPGMFEPQNLGNKCKSKSRKRQKQKKSIARDEDPSD